MDDRELRDQLKQKAELALKKRQEISSRQLTKLEMVKADMVEAVAEAMSKDVVARLLEFPVEKLALASLRCDYDEDLRDHLQLHDLVKGFAVYLDGQEPMDFLPGLMRFIARKLNEKLYRRLDGTMFYHAVAVGGDDIVTPIRKRIVVTVRL